MIISASRRTDIPCFYFEWMLGRLADGYALVRNPMNFRQVSRVPLTPDAVDCIVFWTKNPAPMLENLEKLEAYPYYVQFTINPYGREIESALPEKQTLFDTFRRLADRIGSERVIWRYSPVLLNETYSKEKHLQFFAQAAKTLSGYTKQCKLSFLDLYPKIKKRMQSLGITAASEPVQASLGLLFAKIGAQSGIEVSACGSPVLCAAGIPQAKCIDDALISRITGFPCHVPKDTGQRAECGCVKSVDIGAYDTCGNGCRYCYANLSEKTVRAARASYDPNAPMLCGSLHPEDRVTQRIEKRAAFRQISLLEQETKP